MAYFSIHPIFSNISWSNSTYIPGLNLTSGEQAWDMGSDSGQINQQSILFSPFPIPIRPRSAIWQKVIRCSMHAGRSIDTLCFVIEGNLLGTAPNLFMVRSPTATRDVSVRARRTSTDFLLCIFSLNAQIILNDLRELLQCLIFLSVQGPDDLWLSEMSLLSV